VPPPIVATWDQAQPCAPARPARILMHLILARAGTYEQGASRTVPLVLASVPGQVTPLHEERPCRLDHPGPRQGRTA
jgi:hypothetical protein